ncbi:hypothetical protein [Cellulomonas sp. Leaf334]|uniref:hypothetical protein n=1 Tax=Cellulomonas sp. Leaf334 TaxID=1736339 RepID=UPI0006F9D9D9|nr:hypothetical protein [Cellulomonas sp. Leaf334]KQR16002.1 hypothetical protein ASF78_00715 [Cellulomonas sp. Leaf334]
MPGNLVTQSATVTCAHQGQAKPASASPRVTAGGQGVVLLPTPYTVSGCAYPPQSGGPDATAQWSSGTTRVTSLQQPLAIQGGSGSCLPTGVPLTCTVTQTRVSAT